MEATLEIHHEVLGVTVGMTAIRVVKLRKGTVDREKMEKVRSFKLKYQFHPV